MHDRAWPSERVVTVCLVVACILVFLKNAWVAEDAYITFRSVEQLFAGNGPRWNPHERVQVFTHPLWFGVLSLLRVVTRDLYLASMIASFAACGVAASLLRSAVGSSQRWIIAVLLLLSSKSFFDFTTSGLEGPLSFALIASFVAVYFERLAEPDRRSLALLTVLSSALLLTRHDHATLAAIPYGYFALKSWQSMRWRALSPIAFGSMPFVIWTCFSIFYYGSPVPNTAAAKLATGIPPIQLMTQGWAYLVASTKFDPTWPLLFGGSLLAGAVGILAKPATLEGRARFAIAAGLVMNLLYVVRVGGDFMTGRFLAPIIFLSVILMARSIPHASRSSWVALATVILVTILLPGAPIRSGLDFRNADARHTGVGDERGIFFEYTSLWLYLNRDPSKAFPDHPWTHEGIALASRGQRVYRRANVGILGYWIGTDKIVIDRLGLTDPFLARLPISGGWRIGHFPRQIPVGYLDSVRTGTNAIEDPRLRQLYEQLKLVTQSDLLAAGRFSAMLQIGSQRPATPGDSGS